MQEFKENIKVRASGTLRSDPDSPPKMNIKVFLLLGGILLVTFLAFFPSLQNGFINWDDKKFILDNPFVLSLDRAHIVGAFKTRVLNIYAPLTVLTLAIEHHFFGFAPFVYHLDNLLLHLGVTALVFLFLFQLGLPMWVAGFATLLFGVHPMHVESVAWATERKDVLYAFFYMLALIFYWRYLLTRQGRKYWLSVGFGLLSILAKPMALSLPLILLLLDWLKGRKWNRTVFLDKIPYAAYIIGISLVTYLAFPKGAEGKTVLPEGDIWVMAAIWLWTFSFYVQKFFLPLNLTPGYLLPQPIGMLERPYLIALAVFLICLGIVIRWRRNRWVVFGFAYFLGSIFFILRYGSWVHYTNIVADRFIYLPCLGFCLLAGLTGHSLFKEFNKRGKKISVLYGLVLVFIICCLAGYTFRLSRIWNNSIAYWTYAMEHNPAGMSSFLVFRGYAYLEENQFDTAMADANRALEIDPRSHGGYGLRGLIFHMLGQDQKAVADLNQSLQIYGGATATLAHRASAYIQLGEYDLAIRDSNLAIKLEPNDALAYSNRGKAYVAKGDYDAAWNDFNYALFLNPENSLAYYDRANIYFLKKNYDLALADLTKAITLDSHDSISLDQRGNIYYLKGQYDLALQDYNRALSEKPDFARGYNNRGTLFLALQQYPQALNDFSKAIALNPDLARAYYNRSLAWQAQGKNAEALEDAQKAQSLGYRVDAEYLGELSTNAADNGTGTAGPQAEK